MLKHKLKFSICLLAVLLIISSVCFATNESDIVPISLEDGALVVDNSLDDITYSDLYISDNEADINSTIIGNIYASVTTLNINPNVNTNSISKNVSGNLFATANTVNIKSDVTYSDEIDKDGNKKIASINNASTIGGNVFVTANKFVVEPGIKINGDLFVCANEIVLSTNAIISGNIYAVCNKMDLSCQISGDLYVSCKDFNMNYYGFVDRDLHINAENATIGGYAKRNLFISANNIVTTSNFLCSKDLTVKNAKKFVFSGKVQGNATIKSEQIEFKNEENEENINCKIFGNFNYTSKNEIEIPKDIVIGNSNFTKYSSNHMESLGNFLVSLLCTLVYVFIVYLIIKKFMPNFFSKLSNITPKKMLINLAIGLGILILVPIICILLFITSIGAILGVILALIYAILLLIATPIFAILITEFIKKTIKLSINDFVLLIIITIVLQLLFKIPFVGSILSFLATLVAIGSTCCNNK